MTILADFLRDNYGQVIRIYPNSSGELLISTPTQLDDSWSEPSYTIPTEGYEYRTLADSAGNEWYVYVIRLETEEEVHHEIRISDTAPTGQSNGIWRDPKYGISASETQSSTGNEIYLAVADLSGTGWYVYPNVNGELVITPQVPVPVIPPLSDTVIILSAIYNSTAKTLYVTATSSDAPTATLTATGYGTLSYLSGITYRRTFLMVLSKPASVAVTSSGGGSCTMAIP